jgi:hypothetical protein
MPPRRCLSPSFTRTRVLKELGLQPVLSAQSRRGTTLTWGFAASAANATSG